MVQGLYHDFRYKAVRKVIGGYHGVRQTTLENIAKVDPVSVELWDMKVRASARILEKGIQDKPIEEVEKYRVTSKSWKDHSLAWVQAQNSSRGHQWQYSTNLEEILAAMGENGERKIDWNFN